MRQQFEDRRDFGGRGALDEPQLFWDCLAVRLNCAGAGSRRITIDVRFR